MSRFGWLLVPCFGLCLSLALTLTTHSRLATIASAFVNVIAVGVSVLFKAKMQ